MDFNRFLRIVLPSLVMATVALFQINKAQAAACTPPTVDMCNEAPSDQADHCSTLASYLAEFQQEVCSVELADPGYTPSYAGVVSRANGNLGPSLLAPGSLDRVSEEIDHLAALGSSVIRLDIVYPLLTPSFHAYLASEDSSYTTTADDYVAFYRGVAEIVRARGLQLHIEHSIMLPAYSLVNPTPYYSAMKALGAAAVRERYRQERADEALLLLTELAPDYLTLLTEPDTDNHTFGLVDGAPIYSPAEWQTFVEYSLSRFPAHTTKVGAGAGTWDSDEYMVRLAGIPDLDYIDLHVYPARSTVRNYLSDVLTWSDLVRSIDPSKGITIGESWLYKADANEIATFNVSYVEAIGRDVYSYWEPLDIAFIELLDQAARAKQIEVLTPFWGRYFFAYLDYAETSTKSPVERMMAVSNVSFEQMRLGALTNTGRAYRELALAANPLVIGGIQPNHGPQTGTAQTVVVNGANFTLGNPPTVLFADVAATSVEVVDAATLRVVVPAGSGAVTVTVSSPDGRSSSKPNAYTYDAPPSLSRLSPTQGPEAGGTFVVLEGSGFSMGDAPAQVFFGETPATEVTVYGQQISARIPTGVGMGQVAVKVLNADGQSSILADAYRYMPKPQVGVLSPATGPSSGGTLVTISGSNFMQGTSGTKVLFGGKEATQVTVIDTTTLQVVSPAVMGTITVTVINPDMQSGQMVNAFAYVYPPVVQQAIPYEGLPTGGNEVWITGARFGAGTQVFFGTQLATILSSSPNLLKVTAPAGSGTVPIKVVNADGQLAQAPQSYAYVASPAPAILYFTPSQVSTSGGVKMYLYGQNFLTGAKVYFGSTQGKNVVVISRIWIQVTAPAGQGSVSIRVKNPDGKQALALTPVIYGSGGLVSGQSPDDVLGIGEGIQLPAHVFLPTLAR